MSAMSVQDVKIDPGNGIPYLLDHPRFKIEQGLPYALAQHSGPWHLREAITGSKYVTTDMDKADIVYVYDHCYYMLWLAQASFPDKQRFPIAGQGRASGKGCIGPSFVFHFPFQPSFFCLLYQCSC